VKQLMKQNPVEAVAAQAGHATRLKSVKPAIERPESHEATDALLASFKAREAEREALRTEIATTTQPAPVILPTLAELEAVYWSCPRFSGHSGGCGLSCDELAWRAHFQP